MLRVLIDENLPDVNRALHDAFRTARFQHATAVGLGGTDDVELFSRATGEFDVIVTRDKKQLERADEIAALRLSRMAWLGCSFVSVPNGFDIAVTTAQLVLGLVHVLPDVRGGLPPHAYLVGDPAKVTPVSRTAL